MKTIQDDEGNTYVLKTDMEAAIKERISKVTSRAQEAEEQLRTIQADLTEAQKSAGISDTLNQQLEEYREQLHKANNRYDRYKAISKHGLVDEDMVEAIEWAYEKSMSKVGKKEQVPLTEWLETAVQDPSKAPAVLRPHLQTLQTEQVTDQVTEQVTDHVPEAVQERPTAPAVNTRAQPPTEAPNILQRAANDSDFYKDNREAIQKAWRSKYTTRG
jgi:hypothetical protein